MSPDLFGFSPRKQYIALYLMGGLKNIESELETLGKYTTGKGCLHLKSLNDVSAAALKKIIAKAWKEGQRRIAQTAVPVSEK